MRFSITDALEAAAAIPDRPLDLTRAIRRGARDRVMLALVSVVVIAGVGASAAIGGSALLRGSERGPVGPAGVCAPKGVPEGYNPVAAYLVQGFTRRQRLELADYLERKADVASFEFVSGRQAFDEFKEIYADRPEFWAELPPDALPASFRIVPAADADIEQLSDELRRFAGIDEVAVGRYTGDEACESPGPRDARGLQSFCERANALDRTDRPPTDEELDGLSEAAPEDIAEDVNTLIASARDFRAGNEEAASNDEIQDAGDRFDDYIQQNCS